MDATVLDGAAARQDTVTQLVAQVRRVSKVIPGAGEVAARVCTRLAALTGQGYDQVAKPAIAWDDTDAREPLVSALVGDALDLLAGLDSEVGAGRRSHPVRVVHAGHLQVEPLRRAVRPDVDQPGLDRASLAKRLRDRVHGGGVGACMNRAL